RNIPDADIFFFVMTPGSISSVEAEEGKGGAVNFEVEIATERKIAGENFRFIPILLNGEKPATFLRRARYVDFRDKGKYKETFADLLDSVLGKRKKPPLIGAGLLEYETRVYRMIPAVEGSPQAPYLAKIEPFGGFPFFSYESDHPSYWPPRVYEDREQFSKKVLNFMTNSEYKEPIDNALHSREDRITVVGGGPEDSQEATESKAIQDFSNLRMLFNFTLQGDESSLREQLGEAATNEFLALEKDREAEDARMPNRLLTIAFKHSQDLEISDLTIDMEVVGTVYDMLIGSTRPFDIGQIRAMSTKRTQVSKGPFPGAAVTLIKLWYNYIPLSERFDPKPAHIHADPYEGIFLRVLSADGMENKLTSGLIQDKSVYDDLEIQFPEL
ncbi:MAG: hypothetical protein AAGJ79_12615, partial [Verrucomicrobiota bacterium]